MRERRANRRPPAPAARLVTHPSHTSPSRKAPGATLARWGIRVADIATEIPTCSRPGDRPAGRTAARRDLGAAVARLGAGPLLGPPAGGKRFAPRFVPGRVFGWCPAGFYRW